MGYGDRDGESEQFIFLFLQIRRYGVYGYNLNIIWYLYRENGKFKLCFCDSMYEKSMKLIK